MFYVQSPDKYEPFISKVKQDEKSINHALGYNNSGLVRQYGMFGWNWIFWWTDNNHWYQQWHHESATSGNYEPFNHNQYFLGGEESYEKDEWEIEVFQIKYQ